jgi:hypothetical protein
MNKKLIRQIEWAIAGEAAAHARATLALNPLSEAEALQLGNAYAVYCGSFSAVHGVYGLGLDGETDDSDFTAIDDFFFRKERAPHYWLCPVTDPSVTARLGSKFKISGTQRVFAAPIGEKSPCKEGLAGTSSPDLKAWMIGLARTENPKAKEPSLFSFTKIHQKETRFYLHPKSGLGSYTFFHHGVALVPVPAHPELTALQWQEAQDFGAKVFATLAPSALPLLYERTRLEPV